MRKVVKRTLPRIGRRAKPGAARRGTSRPVR